MINEAHFQYIHDSTSQAANQDDASTKGQNSDYISQYELPSYTSWSEANHFVKVGGLIREYQDNNYANDNKNGTLPYVCIEPPDNSPLVSSPCIHATRTSGSSAAFFLVAHSQTTSTRHPRASSASMFLRSRWALLSSFFRQKSGRVDGNLTYGHS
jgi:hypothetical protein